MDRTNPLNTTSKLSVTRRVPHHVQIDLNTGALEVQSPLNGCCTDENLNIWVIPELLTQFFSHFLVIFVACHDDIANTLLLEPNFECFDALLPVTEQNNLLF